MNCLHGRLSRSDKGMRCMDCHEDFTFKELRSMEENRKANCEHEWEYGYASKPPKAFCYKCLTYATYDEISSLNSASPE